MPRLQLARIPLGVAAAFVAGCCVVTVWNLTVAAIFPRLVIRNWNQLYGLIEERAPPFTLNNFVSGDIQAAFSRQIGATLPIYAPAVRVRNQLQYSLFGLVNAPSVMFGRDKRLYERAYIDEYCKRTDRVNAPTVAAWADDIKDIQDYAALHGKAFIYLITPSKAAIYPEYLPESHACPSVSRTTTTKLPPYERALDERGVHYLDGSSLMAAERERQGITLFPRGGTHWNALAAGLASVQLVSRLKAQNPRLDLDGVSTAWTKSRNPEGTDRDLVNMLNLYWFDTDYPVPKITRDSAKTDQACQPAKIMEVGGSFLEQINVALRGSRCPPQISYWFYWNFAHVYYAADKRRSEPPRDAQRAADLAGSDVILLEENEMNIGETEHLKELHALAVSAGHMGSATEAPAARR
jgi:hypothetical protein